MNDYSIHSNRRLYLFIYDVKVRRFWKQCRGNSRGVTHWNRLIVAADSTIMTRTRKKLWRRFCNFLNQAIHRICHLANWSWWIVSAQNRETHQEESEERRRSRSSLRETDQVDRWISQWPHLGYCSLRRLQL